MTNIFLEHSLLSENLNEFEQIEISKILTQRIVNPAFPAALVTDKIRGDYLENDQVEEIILPLIRVLTYMYCCDGENPKNIKLWVDLYLNNVKNLQTTRSTESYYLDDDASFAILENRLEIILNFCSDRDASHIGDFLNRVNCSHIGFNKTFSQFNYYAESVTVNNLSLNKSGNIDQTSANIFFQNWLNYIVDKSKFIGFQRSVFLSRTNLNIALYRVARSLGRELSYNNLQLVEKLTIWNILYYLILIQESNAEWVDASFEWSNESIPQEIYSCIVKELRLSSDNDNSKDS